MSIKDTEAKVVGYLDAHEKAARIAGWVVVVLNAIITVAAIMRPDFPVAAVGGLTTIVLLWLLVKTRRPVLV